MKITPENMSPTGNVGAEIDQPDPTNYPYAHAPIVRQLEAYLDDARRDPDQRILYEEQVPIMEDLYGALAQHGPNLKGYISVPMGVGKTVLFTEFVKATGLRALVLTPTQLLQDQTEEAFNEFGDSAITVGKVNAREKNDSEQITITTYASFVRHTKNKDSPYINSQPYDVIILDEAHKAMGEETQQALAEYPDVMQLGFTATPRYSERRKLRNLLPVEVHDMSTKEAVQSGLISPFSVWVVETETDMSTVKVTSTNEYDKRDLERVLNTGTRNQVAVELYLKHFAGKKVIFSCSSVEHSRAMAALLQESGIPAEAIHGGLTINQQRELKKRFKDPDPATGLMVLCNDKIIAEGFNQKSVAATFNLGPTLSTVRCGQRSGRALRLNPEDPDKRAVIVEFLDKNYQKPPIIFADKSIGGGAQVGTSHDQTSFENVYNFNLARAHVITDAQAVEKIAARLSRERLDDRPIAPEAWLTLSGLRKVYSDYPASVVDAAVRKMAEALPELVEEESGQFRARGARGGITTYFSPEIERELGTFMERPEVAPVTWYVAAQVAALYGTDPTMTQRDLAKITAAQNGNATNYADMFAPHAGTARKKVFFSPLAVKEFAEKHDKEFLNGEAPGHWATDDDLAAWFGPRASAQALATLRSSKRETLFNNSVYVNEIQHYSPTIADIVETLVTPLKNWRTAEDIAQVTGEHRVIVDVIISKIREEYPTAFNSSTRICWIEYERREDAFYHPKFIDHIVADVRQLQLIITWAMEGRDPNRLEELGLPVLIPEFEPTPAPEIVVADQLASIEFKDVIKIPSSAAIRANRKSLRSAPLPPVRSQPIARPPTSYLAALRRFKSR